MKGLFACFSVFLSLRVVKWPVCREAGSSFLCLTKLHCCIKGYLMSFDAFCWTSSNIVYQHRNVNSIIGCCLNFVSVCEMFIAVFAGFYFHNLSIYRPAYYFNIRNFESNIHIQKRRNQSTILWKAFCAALMVFSMSCFV